MPLNALHRKKLISFWILLFYLLAFCKWANGQWLYQHEPFMFTTRFDGTTWLFMQTGIHKAVLSHNFLVWTFDILFYAFPIAYFLVFRKKPQSATKLAWVWLGFNWMYVQCYTLYPTNSIEAHTAWLLFPLLFCCSGMRSFYFVMHGLRYFFLYFFLSAGIWKLANGGAFMPAQMSAILIDQHKDFLVTSPGYWQTSFIYALINMPVTSFILYWIGMLIELSFVVGFFTRRYDRALIVLFVLFLLFDYLIMRISYIEVAPFLLLFFYSHYGLPESAKKTIVG
jgi:hypothetical protein